MSSNDIYVPHLREGGHIVFDADPIVVGMLALASVWDVLVGNGVGVGVKLSCLHNILWTGGWSLSKFSQIYDQGITKNFPPNKQRRNNVVSTSLQRRDVQWRCNDIVMTFLRRCVFAKLLDIWHNFQ